MQNRYTADIGDFAKYGLLRALDEGQALGIAWYLFPDEIHNKDGGQVAYLQNSREWRALDAELFDRLKSIVDSGQRDIGQIETSGLFGSCAFSSRLLFFEGDKGTWAKQRASWFRDVLSELKDCTVVFADPDNGLCEDRDFEIADRRAWKKLPLSEAQVLAAGRTGVFYHHNTRWPGGHAKEIQHWLRLLGKGAIAMYWRRVSNRTFFIANPTEEILLRAQEFAVKWSPHFELHRLPMRQLAPEQRALDLTVKDRNRDQKNKACPECGHAFKGKGWEGIDAHWRAKHEAIMSYESAWPIVLEGGRPSTIRSSKQGKWNL